MKTKEQSVLTKSGCLVGHRSWIKRCEAKESASFIAIGGGQGSAGLSPNTSSKAKLDIWRRLSGTKYISPPANANYCKIP